MRRLFVCCLSSHCRKPSKLSRSKCFNHVCTCISNAFSIILYLCKHQFPSSSSYQSNSLLMSVNIESTGYDVDYLLEDYPIVIYFNTLEQVRTTPYSSYKTLLTIAYLQTCHWVQFVCGGIIHIWIITDFHVLYHDVCSRRAVGPKSVIRWMTLITELHYCCGRVNWHYQATL